MKEGLTILLSVFANFQFQHLIWFLWCLFGFYLSSCPAYECVWTRYVVLVMLTASDDY